MLRYLTVAVECAADGSAVVKPEEIVLDGSFDHVVWWGDGLPKGGTLEVEFKGPSPFVRLERQGSLVIGSGNLGHGGPCADPLRYRVEARAGARRWRGAGVLLNRVEQGEAAGPIICDPPEGPPSPHCHSGPPTLRGEPAAPDLGGGGGTPSRR